MIIIVDFTSILNKALGISKDIKFLVKEYNEKDNGLLRNTELTYLQLGTILIQSNEQIKEVHIIYKE